ncbi:MAG: hypothetical protein QXP04_04235 [Candidatus Nanoarchaeia archaeon]|nr:hypothetical protein [Candidatus Jingweiarchaeum tengchongense]
MLKKTYVIFSGMKIFVANAERIENAIVEYFKKVKNNEIDLSNVTHFIKIYDGQKEYLFWTIPTLVNMGKLSFNDAIFNMEFIGFERSEAIKLISEGLKKDVWVVYNLEGLK